MAGWLDALKKTRNIIGKVFSSKVNIEELDIEELEEILLRSDVPARLTMEISWHGLPPGSSKTMVTSCPDGLTTS